MGISPEDITSPPIGDLLRKVDLKYRLVISATKRAQQINARYSQPGEGLLENVDSLASVTPRGKPLPVALCELQNDLLQYTQIDPETEAAERATVKADLAFTFVDPFARLDTNSPS